MKRIFSFTLVSMILVFLAACSQKQPSSANSVLNVKVIAADTKTPLSIHFFTLKSNEVFKKLDYFELVDSKKINWNDELVSRAKTLLTPNSTEIFQVGLTEDIQYYALVIGFKDVEDNDNWRYIRAVSTKGDNNIALKLSQINGYTSKAVTRIRQNTKESNAMDGRITKIQNRIEEGAESRADRAIDNRIDRTLGRIFQ
ncbi:MAG: type VI secretion system lipoprotein TssJ [Sulfurovum sp.]|nr:type VI secretion system lipoprotein TssJ [Sulfurovum sp.]